MVYHTSDPPADLRDLVRFWWTLESSKEASSPHSLMAETCANLVVILEGGFTEADGKPAARMHLAGPLSKATGNMGHGPYRIFGAYLWPWAVNVLFAHDPGEFMDRFVPLMELLPGKEILGRGDASAQGMEKMVAELFRSLRNDEARDLALERVVRKFIEERDPVPLAQQALSIRAGRRQFERRFKACTGFSPMLFQRITRFQRCFRMLDQGTANSLTEVALEGGYFDQSHFIRDFRRFGGMDPKHYFRQAPAKVDNFVQLP
jgi:methylphosphotriester-DNA--protein-cysteine methyltransferase